MNNIMHIAPFAFTTHVPDVRFGRPQKSHCTQSYSDLVLEGSVVTS